MLGIIPAAGAGSRVHPLAFAKELWPVGTRLDGAVERPRAVSEYVVERLVLAGATRLCFVIAPGKYDLPGYYGGQIDGVPICYAIQEAPLGLCDAIFRALPFADEDETVAVGLPDTVWFPREGLDALPDDKLSFLLFPVRQPRLFDAVSLDELGRVTAIEVKVPNPMSTWIWGAWKAPVAVVSELYDLWCSRDRHDQHFGTLVNEYIAGGGEAIGRRSGTAYVDVGTAHGYREALSLLEGMGGAELADDSSL